MATLQSRLDALEQQAEAEAQAAVDAWALWVEQNTTPAEHDTYWRAIWAKWDGSNPGFGESRPDDEQVARAIEARAPRELLDRLRAALVG